MKSIRRLPILSCGLLLFLAGVCPTPADLLVIRAANGQSSPVLLRFDAGTGALINKFGELSEGYPGMTLGPDEKIYVTSNVLGEGAVYRFSRDGRFLGQFGNATLRTPGRLAFGPDGNCYVIGSNWPQSPAVWQILRYNRITGEFIDAFVTNAGVPRDLAFGPDGKLYVADTNRGIVRYDGTTGTFLDVFVPFGPSGLTDVTAFVHGPDGNVFVASRNANAVFRFDGATGVLRDQFVTSGSGGLADPRGLTFGPDGHLYVSSTGMHRILRFNGNSGAFMDVFATDSELIFPTDLIFTPPLPRLEIKRAANQVEISWPQSSSPQNWVLLSQGNMAPGTEWREVSATPLLVGTNYLVTDNCLENALYRLEQR
jgi:DNA-binding beta-propeller fold protein YncE